MVAVTLGALAGADQQRSRAGGRRRRVRADRVQRPDEGRRGAGEDPNGRYRFHSQKNSGSRLVTGKRFFTHNGLTSKKARTFDAEAYEGGIVGFSRS